LQEGFKEREDRIAELEEFINDQVTELDKMEAELKQAVANKEKIEKDYEKLDKYYKSAKVCISTIATTSAYMTVLDTRNIWKMPFIYDNNRWG